MRIIDDDSPSEDEEDTPYHASNQSYAMRDNKLLLRSCGYNPFRLENPAYWPNYNGSCANNESKDRRLNPTNGRGESSISPGSHSRSYSIEDSSPISHFLKSNERSGSTRSDTHTNTSCSAHSVGSPFPKSHNKTNQQKLNHSQASSSSSSSTHTMPQYNMSNNPHAAAPTHKSGPNHASQNENTTDTESGERVTSSSPRQPSRGSYVSDFKLYRVTSPFDLSSFDDPSVTVIAITSLLVSEL